MASMDLRSLAAFSRVLTTDEDETMIKRNANGRFLACMLAGLTLAMTVVAGSLGYAVYNSQAFF